MKGLNELKKVEKIVVGILLQAEINGIETYKEDIVEAVLANGVTKHKQPIGVALCSLFRMGAVDTYHWSSSRESKYGLPIQLTEQYVAKLKNEI